MKARIGQILVLTCMLASMVSAQTSTPMGLNQKTLPGLGNQPHYNFWVGGHVCGSDSKANQSIYPASSFVANVDLFEASASRFVMLLGDSFTHISPMHVDAMCRSLGQLDMPVINAMGRREQAQREAYTKLFEQPTNEQFMIGPDVFLVVDSFAPNWDWLSDRLETISLTPAMRHVFVFSSRMPWGQDGLLPSMPTLRDVSLPVKLPSAQAFDDQIKPLLLKLAQIKNVYWFAGNIDRHHIHGSYYWQAPDCALTVVANAMRGDADDSMLNVQVDKFGVVRISPVSLTTGTINAIRQYNADKWQSDTAQWRSEHPQAGFTWYLKHQSVEVLTSKKFAAGIFGGVVFGVLVMMIQRPSRRIGRETGEARQDVAEPISMPTPQPHDLFARLDDAEADSDSRQAA